MITWLRRTCHGLVDLVFPLHCAGCGRTGTGLCDDCGGALGGLRRVARPLLAAGPPVYALGRYAGAARRAVLAYKENGQRHLAEPFGRLLASASRGVAELHGWRTDRPWAVVPAPSRAIASRRRGGAHMARVACSMAESQEPRAEVADCLVTGAGARDSAGLDAAERVRNLSGGVVVRTGSLPAQAARIVLIDDVITTGATVASSLAALGSRGVEVDVVLSLTATAGRGEQVSPAAPNGRRNSARGRTVPRV
ncbi:ComF family protein [Saccharopolyspora taberi]|uniref:ComF family protein n=1 Tax=Saccharopolyspora taberi TaxID=60895 RepID=UPI0031D14765